MPLGLDVGQRLQLDRGVGAHQVGRDLLGVDAEAEMQGVVDDVLFQLEGRVEDVIAGRPADLDAVGRGRALFADGEALQPFQVFRPEHAAAKVR